MGKEPSYPQHLPGTKLASAPVQGSAFPFLPGEWIPRVEAQIRDPVLNSQRFTWCLGTQKTGNHGSCLRLCCFPPRKTPTEDAHGVLRFACPEQRASCAMGTPVVRQDEAQYFCILNIFFKEVLLYSAFITFICFPLHVCQSHFSVLFCLCPCPFSVHYNFHF